MIADEYIPGAVVASATIAIFIGFVVILFRVVTSNTKKVIIKGIKDTPRKKASKRMP